MNRYEFRYGAGGLVIYRVLDLTSGDRIVEGIKRAMHDQAARTLMGPFPPNRPQNRPD